MTLGAPTLCAKLIMKKTATTLQFPLQKTWPFTNVPPPEIAGVPYDQGLLTIGFP